MKSLKELYKIGRGPSSSHTMGPQKAAQMFAERHPDAARFEVSLFGSLAATGKGHLTDVVIIDELSRKAPTEILWKSDIWLPFHPNSMLFKAFDAEGRLIEGWTVYSVGGGALSEGKDKDMFDSKDVYSLNSLTDIMHWCGKTGKSYWEYVQENEESDIWDYLHEVWTAMQEEVERGLSNEGVLPGPLHLARKAPTYFVKASGYKQSLQTRGLLYAYALAVSEENASGGRIVTAPTCGSSGVLPSVLYYVSKVHETNEKRILHAIATAGIIGNVAKHNASISGADVGCQGEVGVACAMAAGAANQLFGGSPAQIEYAAEIGIEHHLGLTCDPVCGLVQIPCIERNAFAATSALDANLFAAFSDGRHSISYDQVIRVMKKTGHDIPSLYKETSAGGLASGFRHKKN